jgi:hypothetical protein
MSTQGYVGVTAYFDRRMKEHHKTTKNRYFRFAIQKYGWGNLIKNQILIADEDYCLDVEAKLRPNDKIGWNLVKGGGKPPLAIGNTYKVGIPSWNKGKPHSAETKQKLSVVVSTLWENPVYRQQMSDAAKGRMSPMKGRKHSAESVERMRLSKIGVPSAKKGIPMGVEQRTLMAERARLISWTCPHCNKLGYTLGAKNRWHFDNCRSKPIIVETV